MVQTPKSEVTRAPIRDTVSFCIQLVSPSGPPGAAVVMHRGNIMTKKEVCVIGGGI